MWRNLELKAGFHMIATIARDRAEGGAGGL